MAYVRRRTVRRRKTARRRTIGRGRYRMRRRGPRTYFYKRFCTTTSITLDSILGAFGSMNFSLNDLPNPTEFTNLYTQYKINAVKISILPQMTVVNSVSTLNNVNASVRFFSAIDYTNDTVPLSVNDLRQYQTCKYTSIVRPHKRFIYKPKILDTSGYTPTTPWISTGSPAVDYYGLKWAADPTGGAQMTMTVERVYYLAFKNVK